MNVCDFDLSENMDMVGAYRIYADLLFGENPRNKKDRTARTLLLGAATRLSRTTKHLEFWINRFEEIQKKEKSE